MNNYFVINRKLFENELWIKEPFTRGQAWVDLFGNANFKDGGFWVRGNYIGIKRGQIGWSEITMSVRWKWSRNKVRRFLKWLEMKQQIEQQKKFKITTIITICNYNKYQNNTTGDTTGDTTERQQTIHNIHKDNKVNKDNKEKRVIEKIYQPPNLTEDDFQEIAEKYKTTIDFVRFQYDKLVTWAESKPDNPKLKGRNWRMTLMTFVRDDKLKITQDYAKQNSDLAL
jgi:hypothetical protein